MTLSLNLSFVQRAFLERSFQQLKLPNYISEATVMSHAERDDVISMKRVRYTCSSVHDIENSEEETLKQ